MAQGVTFATVMHYFYSINEFKSKSMIEGYEELSKAKTIIIDGPDPFKLTEEEWKLIQEHYMRFHLH